MTEVSIKSYCCEESEILRNVIRKLDDLGKGVVMIVDDSGSLSGLLTDGDLRRYLLSGGVLEDKVLYAMNREFTSWPEEMGRSIAIDFIKSKNLRHLPVVDGDGYPIDLLLSGENAENVENLVVIMAGGKGMRLRPHTESCPKPMLEVDGKPMLEHIIRQFVDQGFTNFCLAVNYLGHVIENYFGTGEKFGVSISYLKEDSPLGTGGALGLIKTVPESPMIVCNGDILTKTNYRKMIQYHEENMSDGCIGVRSYQMQIPFGVVTSDEHGFHSIEEKPVIPYQVNAGIYCISPKLLDFVRANQRLDMPELLMMAKKDRRKILAFPVHEIWVDVGRPEELNAVREKNPLS